MSHPRTPRLGPVWSVMYNLTTYHVGPSSCCLGCRYHSIQMMQVELDLPQVHGMSHQFPFWERMLSKVALPLPNLMQPIPRPFYNVYSSAFSCSISIYNVMLNNICCNICLVVHGHCIMWTIVVLLINFFILKYG